MDKQRLIKISDLFKNSFKIYQDNFWTFIKLMSINFLVFLLVVPVWITGFFIVAYDYSYIYLILFFVFLIFAIMGTFIDFWAQISLIFAIKERATKPGLKESLSKGWIAIGSLAWIYLLVGLVVLGGSVLFIIPGIIFSIWFSFSNYIFVAEGIKGREALKASKALVQGYWWAVFGRFLLVGPLLLIISGIPFLGSIINLFFTIPLIYIYSYLIYEDLKRIKS